MKHQFMAFGPFCWGRGPTEEVAIRRMRQGWSKAAAGPYSRTKVMVMKVADGPIAVDGMGRLHWDERIDHDPIACDECEVD